MASKAKNTGTLTYAMLEIAMGAEVNGKLIHASEWDPLQLSFDGQQEERGVITEGEQIITPES